MLALLVVMGGVLLVLVYFSRSAIVPWLHQMNRLNPGVVNKAEWMAPPQVLEAVKKDYIAFYTYATITLPQGWNTYLRDLNHYLCDEMLTSQRDSLDTRLRQDRGRVYDILRANHRLEVRHFSADGLSCVVVDYQTERRLATYEYWRKYRVHTQDIGSATLVYQMKYDQRAMRWKIATYIQTLPPGITQTASLEIQLPHTVGKDC